MEVTNLGNNENADVLYSNTKETKQRCGRERNARILILTTDYNLFQMKKEITLINALRSFSKDQII
uniref:Uncharacterized protein n=1 Tax=Rhizophora mucronata TaxID=61149 RepID=A0A2P2NI68_RHIMU